MEILSYLLIPFQEPLLILYVALGYFMKRFDYPVAPCVLGIILASLLEENFRRGVMLSGSVGGMLLGIFKSPISIVLLLLIVVMFTTQTTAYKRFSAKRAEKKAQPKK